MFMFVFFMETSGGPVSYVELFVSIENQIVHCRIEGAR